MRFGGVAVLPEFTSSGLGCSLINQVYQFAQNRYATGLWATAHTSAVSYYTKLGFAAGTEKFISQDSGLVNRKVFLPVKQNHIT